VPLVILTVGNHADCWPPSDYISTKHATSLALAYFAGFLIAPSKYCCTPYILLAAQPDIFLRFAHNFFMEVAHMFSPFLRKSREGRFHASLSGSSIFALCCGFARLAATRGRVGRLARGFAACWLGPGAAVSCRP